MFVYFLEQGGYDDVKNLDEVMMTHYATFIKERNKRTKIGLKSSKIYIKDVFNGYVYVKKNIIKLKISMTYNIGVANLSRTSCLIWQ